MKDNFNDKNIQQFLEESKQELADNGFTESTINKLPERKKYDWIIISFAFLGSLIAGITGHIYGVFKISYDISIFQGTNQWIFLGIIFLSPFVALIQVLRKS